MYTGEKRLLFAMDSSAFPVKEVVVFDGSCDGFGVGC